MESKSLDLGSVNEGLEEEIAFAYNEYLEAYDALCTCLQRSSISLTKGLLGLKLTERDEIRFALMDNQRLALYCVNLQSDGDFKLDLKSILADKKRKKEKESSTNDEKDVNLNDSGNVRENDELHCRVKERNNGRSSKSDEKGSTRECKKEPKVIDPIKLVHGGFTALSVRQSQKDASASISQIIRVVNSKRRILGLLEKYDASKSNY